MCACGCTVHPDVDKRLLYIYYIVLLLHILYYIRYTIVEVFSTYYIARSAAAQAAEVITQDIIN